MLYCYEKIYIAKTNSNIVIFVCITMYIKWVYIIQDKQEIYIRDLLKAVQF